MPLAAPVLLNDHHRLADFTSGEESLDHWLKRRALANQISGVSRTFVTADSDQVAGYYALSSASLAVKLAPGRFRRNMPDPVPVVLLGRLAVDRNWQRQGIGRALFRDAAMRVSAAADSIGIRGIVVQAISEDARNFYLALGFAACRDEPRTLVVTLGDIRAALDPTQDFEVSW